MTVFVERKLEISMEGVQFCKPLVVAVDALEDNVRRWERVHGAFDVGVDGRVVCHQPDVAVFWLPRSRLEDEGASEEVVGGDVGGDSADDFFLDELHQLVGLAVHVERNGACVKYFRWGVRKTLFEFDGAGFPFHPHGGLEVVAQHVCVVGVEGGQHLLRGEGAEYGAADVGEVLRDDPQLLQIVPGNEDFVGEAGADQSVDVRPRTAAAVVADDSGGEGGGPAALHPVPFLGAVELDG